MTEKRKRLLWAALLSPLAVVPASTVFLYGYRRDETVPLIEQVVTVAAMWSALAVPVAYVLLFVVGIPSLLLAERLKAASVWTAVATGIGAGLLLQLLLKRGELELVGSSVSAYFGVVVAGTFWLLYNRSDRSAA